MLDDLDLMRRIVFWMFSVAVTCLGLIGSIFVHMFRRISSHDEKLARICSIDEMENFVKGHVRDQLEVSSARIMAELSEIKSVLNHLGKIISDNTKVVWAGKEKD